MPSLILFVEQVNGSPACAERMLEPFVHDLKETLIDSIFPPREKELGSCDRNRDSDSSGGLTSGGCQSKNQFELIDLTSFSLESGLVELD